MAVDEQDANEMTILAVRIPTELRERIRDAAKREDRTESSFARYYLAKAADEIEAQNSQPVAVAP